MLTSLAYLPWQDAMPYLLATLALAYLIGSIPFGVIFATLSGAGDLRQIGSGNIGATNVLRTGKKWAAAATLVCDMGKGALAVFLADYYVGDAFAVIAAIGVFFGHLFPVWLRFRGGKGVATFIGITLALFWPIGLLTCISWVSIAIFFRISSLAALVSAAFTPLFFLFWYGFDFLHTEQEMLLFALVELFLAFMIFMTHRANIARLIAGQEPHIGSR
ncbi:MAG: glycerol-3-phosphate 1-O-acyltransferase PlsY [Pseudomonadota bacterium]|jgi:glycerol-3-phosphate acyltransferase PlsY